MAAEARPGAWHPAAVAHPYLVGTSTVLVDPQTMSSPETQDETGARHPAPRRRGWLGWLLGLLLILGLGGGSWWLVQRAKSSPVAGGPGAGRPGAGGPGPGGPGGPPGGMGGRSSVTVGSAVARLGELPVLIDALGTVTPSMTATLVPQVSGVLTEVLFTEGQAVTKGQVLARIDARPYQQTLLQAQGQRARDEAQLAAARVTLQRYETLWKQDSIARQDVDTQTALVKQLQGTVEADRASERAAQLNVNYATIRAPIAGTIGLRAVDPGNLVSSGSATGIATITQVTPIDVVFAVPQDRVPAVLAAARAGKLPVTALDRARTQTLAQGNFLTLDNQINVASGTVKAKARFGNADGQLFPNQFVNVRLQLGTESGVLVPVTAVRTGPQGDYVYVIDADQTARMRTVRRGLATVDQILISQGLSDGEQVVSEGGDRVKDGGRVQLASALPALGASGARGAGGPWGGASGPRRGPRGGASGPRDAASWPRDAASGPAAAVASRPNFEQNRPPAPAGSAPEAMNNRATEGADRPQPGASRPGGLDRLPPEVREKVQAMSPEERRAYFQQLRAAREAAGGAPAPGR